MKIIGQKKDTSFGKNILHRQSASLGHSATGHSALNRKIKFPGDRLTPKKLYYSILLQSKLVSLIHHNNVTLFSTVDWLYSHIMLSWTGLEVEYPSELNAWHSQSPLDILQHPLSICFTTPHSQSCQGDFAKLTVPREGYKDA